MMKEILTRYIPEILQGVLRKKKEIASLTNQRTENPLLPLTATLKG